MSMRRVVQVRPGSLALGVGGALAAAVAAAVLWAPASRVEAAPTGAARGATAGEPAALALLVGIPVYAPSGRDDDFQPLAGPANDVARAERLLRERFGFTDDQIVTLVGPAATHAAIVGAFHRHLIARAGPSTRVVFWFSGHGSRVPDAARRDDSARGAGEQPFDETLVAWDSRQVDPDGGHDVTDDELHSLLAALRSQDVVVVTDCCHSGGVLRGGAVQPGVREVRAGSKALRRERVAAFWPADVMLRDDGDHADLPAVVQLAACGAQQQAGELAVGDSVFGTMTWFLTQALAEADAQTSWAEVAADVRARVAGLGTTPDQRVQIDGAGDRAVFGGTGRPVPKGYQVDVRGSRSFVVGAGALHGVAAGAEFDLLDLDGKPAGVARADRVHTTFCIADWAGTGARPVGALRAVPRTLGTGQPRLLVAIDGLDGELLDGSPVATAVPPEQAEYTLRALDGGYGLFLRDGRCVRHCGADADALRAELIQEQRYRTLWQGVAMPGRFRLRVRAEPVPAELAAARGRAAALLAPVEGEGVGAVGTVVGADVLPKTGPGGGLVQIVVTNLEQQDLHIALVSATESREVNVLYGRTPENVVRAGASITKLVLLGPSAGWPTDQPMADRYVAIATARYADFTPFESAATVGPTRGGEPARPPFLEAALGGTRTRGDTDDPAWGIATCDLQLVTPPVFERTQRR
ncbi:MAG: caspase family protein [Planctomycetes bacterium]|nr:caspase family protein [Planctomycetota bacterium]